MTPVSYLYVIEQESRQTSLLLLAIDIIFCTVIWEKLSQTK